MNALARTVVILTILLTLSRPSAAQEAPLVTDRPDFTESSEVVGPGILQIESGFSYARDSGIGEVTVPGSLLRIGLNKRSELRIGTDGYFTAGQGRNRLSGFSDVELAAKLRLFDRDRTGVDIAVIPLLSLPTGSSNVSSGGVDPTVKLTWARDLPAGIGVSGNYNVSSLSDAEGRFVQQALSVSFDHDLTLGLGGYLEVFGFTPMARDAGAGWTIDSGVSRQIGGNLQFDVEGGRGLTDDAANWFVGFGVALRGRVHSR
jgi:hypothetical protein